MTAKELLLARIETLSEDEAATLLAFIEADEADEDLTDEEIERMLEGQHGRTLARDSTAKYQH